MVNEKGHRGNQFLRDTKSNCVWLKEDKDKKKKAWNL